MPPIIRSHSRNHSDIRHTMSSWPGMANTHERGIESFLAILVPVEAAMRFPNTLYVCIARAHVVPRTKLGFFFG